MPSCDLMHRFLFDHTDIRGEVVTLCDSYQQVLANNHDLPAKVQILLGEFVAAVSLLSSSLKFDGIITLQARGDGPLPLIMAECNRNKALRAIARPDPDADFSVLEGANLQELLGNGLLGIIIDPDKGERYQGVVPLDSPTLSACLEHYFAQSEQLATRFWLVSNEKAATGLMLQEMPRQICTSDEESLEHWDSAIHLANTVKSTELLALEHSQLLYRLFNEKEVRLFEPAAVRFECSCSRPRSAQALISMGRSDVEAMLAEQDRVAIDCQFCNQSYTFGLGDMDELFGSGKQFMH